MRHLIILIVFLSALTSCHFIEMSDNGDLDGYWQMTQVDTIATWHSTDMRDSLFFWAVQMDVLAVREGNDMYYDDIIFHFMHASDSLVIFNPHINNRDSSDIKVTTPEILQRYGIYGLRQSFYVEQLSSSKMILHNRLLRLHFRKY